MITILVFNILNVLNWPLTFYYCAFLVFYVKWWMKNIDVTNDFIKIIINVDMTCQLKEKKSWIKRHSHVTHLSYIWFKLEEIPKERAGVGVGARRWLAELRLVWTSLAMEEGGSQVEVKTVRVRDFQFGPNVPHMDDTWVRSNSIFFFP